MKTLYKTCIRLTLVLFASQSWAQAPVAEQQKPKLVVGIVVDQMRYDYLFRYQAKYGEGGFKRLMREGFSCKNTHFNYVPTQTAPGHAAIFTGATPSVNGIVANRFYNRNTKKVEYCADDDNVKTVGSGSKAGQMSPKSMLSTTIGDELRMASNFKSKVIGVSMKDRGSIFPAGHTANAAYWFDKYEGKFITSSHYVDSLPAWVTAFNNNGYAEELLNTAWNPLLPLSEYVESLPDDNKYESVLEGKDKPTFPYNNSQLHPKNKGYDLIYYTPFGNSLTNDFAMKAIEHEKLGQGPATDMLTVSYSCSDLVGHYYGVNSVEVEDVYLRLDRELEIFLKNLDQKVGKENYLVFLTADHGAVSVPAYLKDMKMPSGIVEHWKLKEDLNQKLVTQFGKGEYVEYVTNEQIYLDHALMEEEKMDLDKVESFCVEYMLGLKGVMRAYSASSMHKGSFTDKIGSMIENGYFPQRSGDIMYVYEPSWMSYKSTGSNHGSPYNYDTHVPLLWMGWNIKPGYSVDRRDITDIAATLSMMLDLNFTSGCSGRPIEDLFGK